MKFGATYEEYLRAEQNKYLAKCSHVEYKRLKKVLKRCRVGRSLQDGMNSHEQQDGNTESSDVHECNSCACKSNRFDDA
jgi:E3 ubiquitin-protein ligase BAH